MFFPKYDTSMCPTLGKTFQKNCNNEVCAMENGLVVVFGKPSE